MQQGHGLGHSQQRQPDPFFEYRLERRERRRSYIFRHQATLSFLFALAALVQSLGSLVYLASCRCYPVPLAAYLAGNIVYVVLFVVYVAFWLWSRRHAAYAHRDPSPRRWWRLYNASGEPAERPQQPQSMSRGVHREGPGIEDDTESLPVRHPEPADLGRGLSARDLPVPKAKHE
ncbi:hypothetical protein PG985_010327 [Apiospora marii]|uniref:Uncharacterized protein n=1 Tax=Apiospora marii TaxID=335849 RepID=A0ABR1RLN0_9PEZI